MNMLPVPRVPVLLRLTAYVLLFALIFVVSQNRSSSSGAVVDQPEPVQRAQATLADVRFADDGVPSAYLADLDFYDTTEFKTWRAALAKSAIDAELDRIAVLEQSSLMVKTTAAEEKEIRALFDDLRDEARDEVDGESRLLVVKREAVAFACPAIPAQTSVLRGSEKPIREGITRGVKELGCDHVLDPTTWVD